jgi:hypothetical protein
MMMIYSDSCRHKSINQSIIYCNRSLPTYLPTCLLVRKVLEILQRANVNIASMNVARAALPAPSSSSSLATDSPAPTGGGMALCFMALDDDVSTNAMNSLLSLSFLQNVNKIQLQ